MTIYDSNSIKPTTIRITEKDFDPIDLKSAKVKDIQWGVYEGKWNWIEGLF